MAERVSVALVGVKNHGATILEAIGRSENLRLAGVCDVDRGAAVRAATANGCPAVESLQALLSDSSISGIAFVTPNYLHEEQCIAAAHATPSRLRIESSNPVEERRTKDVDVFVEEVEEFGRMMIEGTRPETDGDGALLALAVVEAALRSSAEQRFVSIEELLC